LLCCPDWEFSATEVFDEAQNSVPHSGVVVDCPVPFVDGAYIEATEVFDEAQNSVPKRVLLTVTFLPLRS